ncbi:4033_t:CDS:1, partial [Cetraspora pellucida]
LLEQNEDIDVDDDEYRDEYSEDNEYRNEWDITNKIHNNNIDKENNNNE